jgi:hypothetical protein
MGEGRRWRERLYAGGRGREDNVRCVLRVFFNIFKQLKQAYIRPFVVSCVTTICLSHDYLSAS